MSLQGSPRLVGFSAVKAAQLTAANGSAAALSSTVVAAVSDTAGICYLQADPGNTASSTIKLGDSDGQYVSLAPGDWFPFPLLVSNLNLLYALGSTSGLKLNVLITY